MNGVGKITIELTWDDTGYDCRFKRGRYFVGWQRLSRDEQIHAVGAMVTMSTLFEKNIKTIDEVAK